MDRHLGSRQQSCAHIRASAQVVTAVGGRRLGAAAAAVEIAASAVVGLGSLCTGVCRRKDEG